MASNCTQTGTSSALVKETASITWILNDFTNLTEAHSPKFSSPNSKLPFRFGILLKASPAQSVSPLVSDNVIIYLYPFQSINEEKLDLEYEVSILDSQNRKCYTKTFQCSYRDKKYSFGLESFISYPRLIKKENGFIVSNKLTLFCEVKILKDRTPLENTSRVIFNNKIIQNYQSLLESGKFSDIVLVVGEKNFMAHKIILSAQSPVFAAMFDKNETKEVQEGRVEIVDICVDVFEVLLRYIYTGEVVQLKEYAEELLVAADKYQLESLKSLCEQSLLSSLSTNSVIKVFMLADMHNSAKLKANCLEYITKHSAQVMKSNAWKVLIQSRPQLLIELYQDLAAKTKSFFDQ